MITDILMKTLLYLNGPEGWQTGIEDGFSYLQSTGVIEELKWFYLHDFSKKNNLPPHMRN